MHRFLLFSFRFVLGMVLMGMDVAGTSTGAHTRVPDYGAAVSVGGTAGIISLTCSVSKRVSKEWPAR